MDSDLGVTEGIAAAMKLPLLDEERFSRIFGDNDTLKNRVLGVFLESAPKYFDKFIKSYDSGNLADLASLAHTLKGSLSNIGGQRSAELARIIEINAKAGDKAALENVCDIFISEFEAFRSALEKA